MFITRSDVKVPEESRLAACSTTEDQSMSAARRRKTPFPSPFASLSSAVMSHLPQSSNSLKREQATGMEFPEECCVLTQKNCPVLAGFG